MTMKSESDLPTRRFARKSVGQGEYF